MSSREVQTGRHGPAGAQLRLPPAFRVAALAVLLAASCVAIGFLPDPKPPAGTLLVPWWVLVPVFVVTEVVVIRIRVRREEQSVSISELPLVVGLFVLAPPLLLLARLVGSGAAFVAIRRTTALKTSFNLALVGAGTTLAAVVFHLVTDGAPASTPRGWLGAVLATAAAGLLEGLALTLVISWYDGMPALRVVGRQLLHALALPAAVAVAGVVAATVLMGGRRAGLPLLLTGAALLVGYRAHAVLADRHAAVTRLFALSESLLRARTVDDVARAAVTHAVDVLKARSATLLVHRRGSARVSCWSLEPGAETVHGGEVAWPHPAFDVRSRRPVRGGTQPESALLAALDQVEAIVVPLPLQDDVDAVLLVGERVGEERGYGTHDVRLLETLGNHVNVALRHATTVDLLRFEALHDQLTGLPNRAVFRRHTDEAAARTLRGGPPVAVGVLDLDGFKSVNDSLGHHAGDQVIAEVARRLERAAAPGVEVGRLGGDEFGVLVQDASDRATVAAIAGRLVAGLAEPLVVAGEQVRLGGSLGLAFAPADGGNADALLRSADVAMYTAKQESGGVRCYAPEMVASNDAPLALAADLRLALGRGEVGVHVQPLVDLDTGLLHSVEALARWRHAELGPVNPEMFVLAAERGGLVQELTGVVLERALAACRGWLDAGHEVPVAVNLAARTLGDDWLPTAVGRLLERYTVPGRLLCLEVTEGGVIASPERAMAVVGLLRALGVSVAVDDFGTGYSSLTYLSWLAPDQVKIDRSFVERLGAGSRHEAIVRSIIDLGKNLGVEVVAEGVGDARTAAALRRLGCGLAQGFWFAEPMPTAALLDWVEDWRMRTRGPAAVPVARDGDGDSPQLQVIG